MSAPNQALAEALASATTRSSVRELLEAQIKDASTQVNIDTIVRRGPGLIKYPTTVACMLCYSNEFRALAARQGVNLTPFDVIVEQMGQHWLAHNNQPAPAKKIITILNNTPVDPTPF